VTGHCSVWMCHFIDCMLFFICNLAIRVGNKAFSFFNCKGAAAYQIILSAYLYVFSGHLINFSTVFSSLTLKRKRI